MRRPSRFSKFVLASAALHVLALLLAARVDWSPLPPTPEPLTVRVIPLAPSAPARPAPPTTERPATPQPAPETRAARPVPRATPAPRATPPPRPTPAPRAAPTPPPARRPDGQVVDLPARPRPGERNEPPPDDTRFLSDRNRTADRQTRAPATPAAPDRAPGAPGTPDGTRSTGPTEPRPGARPRAEAETPAPRAEPATPPAAPPAPVPAPRAEPPVARQAPATPPAPPAVPPAPAPQPRAEAPGEAVGRATPPQPARPGDGDTQVARVEPPRPAPPAAPRPQAPVEPPRDLPPPASPGTTSRARTSPDPNRRPDTDGDGDGTRRTLPGLDKLLPGPGQLARVNPNATEPRRGAGGQGGGRASDYLPDVEEGEETFLNSREFRYAYYFNQVKRGIAAQWNPHRVLETTREAVPAESLTQLLLVIGKDGRVESAEMIRSSGVASLDQEAARAVRAAGPYPAPPAGVLDQDGRLRFPFGFAVLAGTGRVTYFGPDDRDLRDLFRRPPFRPRQ